jgi:hypothetical protein
MEDRHLLAPEDDFVGRELWRQSERLLMLAAPVSSIVGYDNV